MKYSQETINEITGYIESGMTAKDACFLAGISEETFYVWKREKAEFSESLERARFKYKASLIKRIEKVSEKNWRACAWLLERLFPEDFLLKSKETILNEGKPRILAEIMMELDREEKAIGIER